MKLFLSERAPNPVRVEIFLREKGVKVNTETIDIMKEEAKADAFAQMNPMKRVPVLLLDNGTVISESVAICRYFEVLNPEPALMGRTAEEQAVIEMWNRRAELNLFLPITHVFRHAHPAMAHLEVPQIEAWSEANRPKVDEAMKIFDEQLTTHDYVAGDTFTIADITAYVAINFCKPARIEVPERFIHLNRWAERLRERPSIKG